MTEPTEEYDFVVIGGGSAGYAGAATAVGEGLTVAVIEGGEEVGGLCILHGCMPSKAVLESAKRFRTIMRAEEFGLRADDVAVVGEEIIARKERLIGEFAEYRRGQLEDGRFTFIRGHAKFADAHTLEIELREGGIRRIRGRSFLVATGSSLAFMDLPGLCDLDLLDSNRALDSQEIPESIIILGGGAIALEFATYYCDLGAKVTVIQRSKQVLSDMDEDVAHSLQAALAERGVVFHLGTDLTRAEKRAESHVIYFSRSGAECEAEAEAVLYALGRRPRTGGLGLNELGVTCEKYLEANARQQTGVPHIFAAGDVTGPHEIVHLAVAQGGIAARNAARLLGRRSDAMEESDDRLKLMVVFSEPEVATVGASEKELRKNGVAYRVASYPLSDHGKALVLGEPEGFVKLMTDRASGEILGGAIVGAHGSDLIHEIVVAMHFHSTAADLARIPHYHPTLSEIWTYPAEELAALPPA